MASTIDLDSFLSRKGMTQADLARALKTTPGNVSRWTKGGEPSYDLCKKLLELGMTVEELFGIKNPEDKEEPLNVPKDFNTPEFQAGVKKALEDLKAKGLI